MPKILLAVFVFFSFQCFSDEIRMRKMGDGFLLMDDNKPVIYFQRHPDSVGISNYIKLINPNSKQELFDLKFSWQELHVNDEIINPLQMENFNERVSDLEFVQQKDKSGILSYQAFWKEDNNSKDPFLKISTEWHVSFIDIQTYHLKINYTLKSMDDDIVFPVNKKSFPNGLFISDELNRARVLRNNIVHNSPEEAMIAIDSIKIDGYQLQKAKWVMKNDLIFLQMKKQRDFIIKKNQPINFIYHLTFHVR